MDITQRIIWCRCGLEIRPSGCLCSVVWPARASEWLASNASFWICVLNSRHNNNGPMRGHSVRKCQTGHTLVAASGGCAFKYSRISHIFLEWDNLNEQLCDTNLWIRRGLCACSVSMWCLAFFYYKFFELSWVLRGFLRTDMLYTLA